MNEPLLVVPEFIVLLGALVAFACSAFDATERFTWGSAVFFASLAVVATLANLFKAGEPFFPGIYQVDVFSQTLKLGVVISLLLTNLISQRQESTQAGARIDVPFFLFLASLGMMMLVSATELLTFYVALEFSAYGLFILVALHRRERMGSEAAAKYLLFGAAASAVSLYGLSLIFGASGSTYVSEVVTSAPTPLLIAGIVLTLSGLLFKLGAVPFHGWAPDVYQGAPHQGAAFLGTASKVAAVGALLRILSLGITSSEDLVIFLIILCVASMSLGNLAALVQRDLKRLLGFSAIAHAGYLLIGLLCFSLMGTSAAIFYILTYVPIVFCVFLVITVVGQDENPSIKSLAGLYKRSPLLALVLLVGMFGLAGIPPTPGLAGKWFLFSAAIAKGHLWLVIVAAINATISLYYYLQVVREAYLAPPEDDTPITLSPGCVAAAIIAMALVFFAGFYPGPTWSLASEAAKALYF